MGIKKFINQTQTHIFLNNIKVIGDKRIGYNLKNEIVLNSSSNSINKIDIRLDINKRKETKEKNISNKITKFSILISVNLFLKNNENDKEINKTFNKSVDYDVVSNHSDTISNEENSTQILTDQIGRDIVNFLNLYFIN